MKRVLRKLLEALYFLLCYGPIPLIVGYAVADNGFPLLIVSAMMVPIAFLISLLPGYVGGAQKKQDVFVERTASHGDPDPDRSLRRDTHEDVAKRRPRFPLRAFVCVVLMLAAAVVLFFGLAPDASEIAGDADVVRKGVWTSVRELGAQREPITRAVECLVAVLMLPAALWFTTSGASTDTRNVLAGVIIYCVGGISAVFVRNDTLNLLLGLGGSAFIAVALWLMNDRAMHLGAASRAGVKPPATMRRRNRALLIGVMAISALVAGFSWLEEKVAWLAAAVARGIGWILLWIGEHFGSDQAAGGGGGGSGDMDLSALGENTEPSKFWEAMTYVAYVIAAVVLLILLYLAARRIGRGLRSLYKKFTAWLGRFAQTVGEDYRDEQESLLDWGEVQREMGESLRKRFAALFQRDKKWDDMNGRERARALVRALYRRAKLKADGRTLHLGLLHLFHLRNGLLLFSLVFAVVSVL
ncbi:MAG: hypothetical protein J5998_08900, partial [Clostridia bacterium]|nr:hypothetical protein [Clostridia bacterium]